MSRYDVTDDPLCYPGTQVLINKADLTDQDDLDQLEHLMFLTRAEESLPEGVLDYDHYKAIHHHFFQDVYVWAGSSRTIRTGKNGNWFCYPEFIETEMQRIFAALAAEGYLATAPDPATFAARSAYFIAEINAVHPFREGNGRCQLALLNSILEMSGFEMDENKLDPSVFMSAMIASFHGNLLPLRQAILAVLTQDQAG